MSSPHDITLQQAITMTQTFRNNKEQILQPQFQGKNILVICESFSRDIFDEILSVPGCAGVRIYFGMNEDLTVRAVMVATDANSADILPATGGVIGEVGLPCPPICPPPSALNGF
jgi:hypothetical protein